MSATVIPRRKAATLMRPRSAGVTSIVNRAVKAGATVEMPVDDMFWGDRYGKLTDPFGHKWSIGTHTKDMSMDEMNKGMEESMAKMPKSA